jgi:hypothetical protein
MGVGRPVNRVRGTLESLNCDGRLGLALLCAALLLLLPTLGGEPARLALRYDRAALASRSSGASSVLIGASEPARLRERPDLAVWALFAVTTPRASGC